MDDLDALRCAKLLLDRHGRDAELHAAMRVDELDAAGDDDGWRAWMRILAAYSGDLERPIRSIVNT